MASAQSPSLSPRSRVDSEEAKRRLAMDMVTRGSLVDASAELRCLVLRFCVTR